MLHFSQPVENLVSKCTDKKTAFGIQRWAELLDPGTHFYYSIHLEISPLDSIMEAIEIRSIYKDRPTFTVFHLISSLRRTLKILKMDRILDRSEFVKCAALQRNIKIFLSGLDVIPRKPNPTSNYRATYIDAHISDIEADLKQAHAELQALYYEAILNDLRRKLQSHYSDRKRLRHIESSITQLARRSIDEGRSPVETIEKLSHDLKHLEEISYQDFISWLEDFFDRAPHKYEVAVVLDGVGKLTNQHLPAHIAPHCQIIKYGRIKWKTQSDPSSLKEFCATHWDRSRLNSSKRPMNKSVVLRIDVEAWDPTNARERALSTADSIADLLNVANRNERIGVKRKVLILDPTTNKTSHKQGDTRVHNRLSSYGLTSYHLAANSLRFASRVKTERSKIVSVLFAWISLESFFAGSSDAQNKVIDNIAPLGSRAASRGIISNCRTMLTVELSNIYGSTDSIPWKEIFPTIKCDSQNRPNLFSFYDCFKNESEKLEQFDDKFSPLTAFRIKETSQRISSGDSVAAYISEIQEKVVWALTRMAHLRNQTVHSALTTASPENSLDPLCKEILDFTFEVISILDRKNTKDYQSEIELYSKEIRNQISAWGSTRKEDPPMLGESSEAEYEYSVS